MRIIIYLTVLTLALVTYQGDTWWSKWTAWEYIAAVAVGWFISKRYGIIAGICATWPLISAIVVFGNQVPINNQNGGQILSIENVILKATVSWLLTILPISWLSSKDHESCEDALAMFCLADSIYVIYQLFQGVPMESRGGFLGNPSMNGSLIALTYCFLGFRPEEIEYAFKPIGKIKTVEWGQVGLDSFFIVIPVVAVFLSGSSIPVGVLAVVWASYFVIMKQEFIIALLLSGSIFFAGSKLVPDFFGSSGRFGLWKITLDWWWKNADHWLGTANGSFFLVGPVIQMTYDYGRLNWFVWTHNDWLQTLVEQGYPGLFFFLVLFACAVFISWRRKRVHEFAAIMGYGAAAFFNFPAHNILFALTGLVIAARTFDNQRNG